MVISLTLVNNFKRAVPLSQATIKVQTMGAYCEMQIQLKQGYFLLDIQNPSGYL